MHCPYTSRPSLQSFRSSRAEELEKHREALAMNQAGYESLHNRQKQQEELLHQLSAERDQLQKELSTAKEETGNKLQKLLDDNEALREQVRKYETEIKEQLSAIAECNKQSSHTSHEYTLLKAKYDELVVEQSKCVAGHEVNMQVSFQELAGGGTTPDEHAELDCRQDPVQQGPRQPVSPHAFSVGNSKGKIKQQLAEYRRKYHSVSRAYNSLLNTKLIEHTPAWHALQELAPNLPSTWTTRAAREEDQLCKMSRFPNDVSRVRSRERPWRNTRARATVSDRDPHDDFLDTPRDLAGVHAVNHCAVTFEGNQVPREEAQSGINGGSNLMPLVGHQQASLNPSSKPAGYFEPIAVTGQDAENNGGGTSNTKSSQLLGGGAHKRDKTENGLDYHQRSICEDKTKGSMPQMRPVDRHRSSATCEKGPSTSTAPPTTRKKSFSLAGAPYKYVEPVRKKRDREALVGAECRECRSFYDAILGADPDGLTTNRCQHYDAVSRHRYRYAPPQTPEGFWNIGFESDL